MQAEIPIKEKQNHKTHRSRIRIRIRLRIRLQLRRRDLTGVPQFDVFGDSLEVWISWCRLLRCRPKEKAVNQVIVQEWLPTLTSITVFTA